MNREYLDPQGESSGKRVDLGLVWGLYISWAVQTCADHTISGNPRPSVMKLPAKNEESLPLTSTNVYERA